MNVNEKGNIGLSAVIFDLTKKGYNVFLPLADTDVIDLLVTNNDGIVKRIQIKYRTINKFGVLEVSACSVVNGKRIKINKNKIDYFAVYNPETDKVYYVPMETFSDNQFYLNLRIVEAINKVKSIIYAKDYIDLSF